MSESELTGEFDVEYEDGDDVEWSPEPTETDMLYDVRQQQKRQPKCYDPAGVRELIRAETDDIVNVLAWSRTSALLLLRHFKWNKDDVKERFFEDPEAVTKRSRVENMPDDFIRSDTGIDCGMCWDPVPAGGAAALACGHAFCMDCWSGHLKYHLDNSAANSIAVRCPMAKCPQFCGRKAFAEVFGAEGEEVRRYDDYVVRSYVNDNEHFRECPAPGCERAMHYPLPKHLLEQEQCPSVKCDCGFRFCFRCSHEEHGPASCDLLRKWLKKEVDESETANWMAANTKPCPGKGCGKLIEKNGGCNHMTCASCRYDFCWVCEGPWSAHGSNYYNCNQFKEGDQKDRNKNRDEARTELERYMHYYTRYRNHALSKKLDNEVLKRTRARIAEELKTTAQTLIDLDYLETTAQVLIHCRHALMYTYVYAFYLTDEREKALFEFNQSQLEYSTERLSEFIEDTVNQYSKQDVVNRTSTADKMLQKLQEGCLKIPK